MSKPDDPKSKSSKPTDNPPEGVAPPDAMGVDPSTGSPTPVKPGEEVGAVHAVPAGTPPPTVADDLEAKRKADEAKKAAKDDKDDTSAPKPGVPSKDKK
jgi:hypothetical protein